MSKQGGRKEAMVLSSMARARVLLKPLRMEMLQLLAEDRTCSQLAEALGITPQKANYHVHVLVREGLVEKVSERRVRGCTEVTYRATADSFWLSPGLTQQLGGRRETRQQMSIGYMMELGQELLTDAERLAMSAAVEPVLSVNAQVELASADDRKAFMKDVEQAVQRIAERYGARDGADITDGGAGQTYRLMLACYRRPEPGDTQGSNN